MEKSLVKALRVVEALAFSDRPRGVSDLAEQLGYHKSNVHRILNTLMEEGYVVQYDTGAVYQLNYKLMDLGVRQASRLRLSEVARPYIRRIAEQTGESAHIMIYHDGEIVYLEKIEAFSPLGTASVSRLRAQAYCVASGKVLLAYRSDEEVRRVLRKVRAHTPHTVTNLHHLKAEIDAVHTTGFAINRDGWVLGETGAAAPVLVGRDNAIAALAINGSSDRLTDARLAAACEILKNEASALSRELGYTKEI